MKDLDVGKRFTKMRPWARAVALLCTIVLVLLLGGAKPSRAESGWLLLLPPVDLDKTSALPVDDDGNIRSGRALAQVLLGEGVRTRAPFIEWEQHMAFDSALDCETARLELRKSTKKEWEAVSTRTTATRRTGFSFQDLGKNLLYSQSQGARCLPVSVLSRPKE